MKLHPLAEGHLDSPVIQPSPGSRQSRHQLPILVKLHEVLEDVPRNPRPVLGVWIHHPQFPAWRWRLFPKTHATPPEGDERQDHATNDKLFHGCPSLVVMVGCRIAQPPCPS